MVFLNQTGMKLFYVLLPVLMCGCAKDKASDVPYIPAEPTIAISPEKPVRKEVLRTGNPVDGGPDMVELVITDRKTSKNDTIITGFRADFYRKGTRLKSFPFTAQALDGYWSLSEDFLNDGNDGFSDTRFLAVNNGYDACGYLQTDYVFFIGESGVTFVDRLESLSDSGYGTWSEMLPEIRDGKPDHISRRTVEVNPDEGMPENDENQPLEVTYRDSIRYDLVSGTWRKTQLTPKGRVYRTEKTTFNAYHNPD